MVRRALEMRRIVFVGAVYLDTILTVPHFPGEDEKLRATSISRRRGGNCPNSVEVLQQLLSVTPGHNVSLAMCAVLPSESSTAVAEVKASLGPGVDLSACIFREEVSDPASSYILKSAASGSRTIVNFNPLREMTVDEFAARIDGIAREAVWYHFEGRIPDVTLQCIHHLRRTYRDVTISVEVEKPAREGLEDLAAAADVVFYSKSWAQSKGYESAEACLNAQTPTNVDFSKGAKLLCCTWGGDGASFLHLPGREAAQCPAFVRSGYDLVDSVGAGDTFIAGVLFCMVVAVNRLNLAERLEFANELAGRKVAQEGFSGLGEAMQDQCKRVTSDDG